MDISRKNSACTATTLSRMSSIRGRGFYFILAQSPLRSALVARNIDPAGDEDGNAEQGPGIRELAKGEETNCRNPDQLRIAERRQARGRGMIVSLDQDQVPEPANRANTDEQGRMQRGNIQTLGSANAINAVPTSPA